jgi:hypothetical protein
MKRKSWLAFLLVIALLFPLASLAQHRFEVVLDVQPQTVQEGKPITVHARTEGAVVLPVTYTFTWYCVEDKEAFMVLEDTNTDGVSTLPHPFGDDGWVEVSTVDSMDRWGAWQKVEFTVTGGTPNPLRCLAQTDKQIIDVGEEITGYAIVEGGTPPYNYYYIWEITEQGQTYRFAGVPSMEEENTQTIPYGEMGSFSFGVRDSVGRTGSADRPFEFGIFGATPNPLQGTATVDKTNVAIGEEFQVSVDLTGGEAPYQFTYTFDYDPPDDYEDVRSDSPTLAHKLFKTGSWYLSVRVRDTFGRVLMLDEIEITVSKEQSPPGDANEDGVVDILDLVEIINYIVYDTTCRSMLNADANGDGIVDILDLVWIINRIISD